MIPCKSCGASNPPSSAFCEDCGAQILGAEEDAGPGHRIGPLAVGASIAERFVIDSVYESGLIYRYKAMEGERAFLLLESLRLEDSSVLAGQRELLGGVPQTVGFQPKEFLSWESYDVAVGALPGKERLDDRVAREGALKANVVEQMATDLLDALAQLHKEKLVCRAVQPNRIWLNEDGPPILDCWERTTQLGQVRDEDETCSVTPGYSAPEMYGLGTLDQRADLFSLGATLYFALTGTRPNFESRESFFSVPPPQVDGHPSLVHTVMKSLAKSPSDRFPDAAAMKLSLTQPPPVPQEEAPRPAPRPAPAPSTQAPSSSGVATAVAPPRRVATLQGLGPKVALKSDIGCVRSINQDACLELRFRFVEKSRPCEGHLVVVVDGMGGEAEGDKAASIALRTLAQEMVEANLALRNGRATTPLLPPDPEGLCRTLLKRALEAANRNIFEYASLDDNRRGMGCTITACLLLEDKAFFGHVGDTRGYHYRDHLDQVTTDHSLVGRLVALGSLTPEEARVSPQRSIIYRAMGTSPDIEVDIYERDLRKDDRIVLCSDGVWEYYEEGEFATFVAQASDPEDLCEQLVATCLKRGADDNATIAVVQV